MIEMRIVDHGIDCYPQFQYRYKLPENEQWVNRNMELVEWSNWETAERVKVEDIENV
jgi:hypothetical protein